MTRGTNLWEGSGPGRATHGVWRNSNTPARGDEVPERLAETDQRFEQVLLQLSTTFVSAPANQIDKQIERALRQVVQFLGLDRGMLSRFDAEITERWVTHSWAVPGLDPPPQVLNLAEVFPWGSEKILAGEIVAFSRLEELPEEAAVDRETGRRLGIQSHVSIPLVVGQTVVGTLSLSSTRRAYAWPGCLIERLQLLAQVFSNALARQRAELTIERQLRFEWLVTELSSTFINLPATQVDQEVTDALRRIIELLDLDRGNLVQLFEDGRFVSTHSAASSAGLPLAIGRDSTQLPWLADKIRRREVVRLSRLPDDLPPEAEEERLSVLTETVKSHLSIPLVVSGAVIGAFTCDSVRARANWPDELVGRLQLLVQVFANALARKQADMGLQRAFSEIQQLRDRLQAENSYLRQEVALEQGYEEIVGNSDAIKGVLSQTEHVARTNSTVLLLGETGTGKELLAQAIHRRSARKDRLMVKVNCAALPSTLVESELFGREKGAYTGALSKQVGRFEFADGSTIFLDEIGALPLELQAKLLHVLQDGQFERLGSTRTIKVDVRVIAATNCDLAVAVRQGRFRDDLYYRLNVFPIVVPPLRERRDDIPPLVWTFVREFGESMGKSIESIPRKAMDALQAHRWPGNVRELRNVIERAMILTTGPTLHVELAGTEAPIADSASATLEEVDRRHILSVLERTKWRVRGQNGAAEILGLRPTTLESRIQKLGIDRPSDKR